MSRTFVSVVIPHYNDLDNLARCLDGLRRQSWPAAAFEIIVADNNSAGGVAAVAAIAADVRVVPAPEQGAGPARNAGAAVARGEVLAFIDSDCRPQPDWLERGIDALADCDYAGGRVVTQTGPPALLSPAEAYEAVFAFDFARYIELQRYAGTGNLFVPRAVFDRVGGFRAGVAEDMEWCWRANAIGFRLGYAPAAVVGHQARRDWTELTRKHRRMARETLRLWQDWPDWRRRWLRHALLVALSPLGHWLRVMRSPNLPGIRAKAIGVAGLFAIRLYRSCDMLRLLLETRRQPRTVAAGAGPPPRPIA